ncbi:MAG: hypothetical protein C3F14_09060 [Deltaproteobacteria bacterium]|nr:MAG: hypothetical protein C3F14_09060 [Deltaproteobacteria bacterium]
MSGCAAGEGSGATPIQTAINIIENAWTLLERGEFVFILTCRGIWRPGLPDATTNISSAKQHLHILEFLAQLL